MRVLVTGSSGHLGEALVRSLRAQGADIVGLDIVPSPFTDVVGSITDRERVARCIKDVRVVYHTATLHKPHVATHTKRQFVKTNIDGTLALLEAAKSAAIEAFVFTSTTSVFGYASRSPAGSPAAWITEDVTPIPRNIYGVTKSAAEELCHLFHRTEQMNCVVLRTSRFFPEEDDDAAMRDAYSSENAKANEFLCRRVDLEDIVSAHLLAAERAPDLGFARYIISATSPFTREDLAGLRADTPSVVRRYYPESEAVFAKRGWSMFPSIDRVYVNAKAVRELQWKPKVDFGSVLDSLRRGEDPRSPTAIDVGSKGYHSEKFTKDGPYPV